LKQTNIISKELNEHIDFSYSSFDRVLFRGYLPNVFIEGQVIRLLRNLGFKTHSNGVLKLMTDQLNAHIKKQADRLKLAIHWWGTEEKKKYKNKIDYVQAHYSGQLKRVNKKSEVICIIKAVENIGTFANRELRTKKGKVFTKMYSCHKFVSQYYIYIHDQDLGLCYLKISSYMPFICEFYMNGHNYLRQKFDLYESTYKMYDNSFVKVSDLDLLDRLVKEFQPSIALKRIDYWLDIFFRFNKGDKSTCSKLLKHQWYTYQTEISTNIIFKSPRFAKNFFQRVLQKHHTIGLPDRLTEIFGLTKPYHTSKSVQHTYGVQACIKHWMEKNSVKGYNKGDCLLRVETTINNPGLPGLKLKKPACNLQAYYWYGLGCNSRYLTTLLEVDISSLSTEAHQKYQQTVETSKGTKVAAPDLRKPEQVAFLEVLLNANNYAFGFKNRDLRGKLGKSWKTAKVAYEMRKLRERGAIKKKQNTHYYQLTEEGLIWVFYSIFSHYHFVTPLLSKSLKKALKQNVANPSKIEQAYSMINDSVSLIVSEFGMAA
jgi:hypothetical protein